MTDNKVNKPEVPEDSKDKIIALGVDLDKLPISASYEELETALPEVAAMKGLDQRSDYHSLTLDEHTKELVRGLEEDEFVQKHPKRDLILLAGKFHDLGKTSPKSTQVHPDDPKKRRYAGHEVESARITREILEKHFDLSEEDVDFVAGLTRLHASALNLIRNFEDNPEPKGKDLRGYENFAERANVISGDISVAEKMKIVFILNIADIKAGYNETSDHGDEKVEEIIKRSDKDIPFLYELIAATPAIVDAIEARKKGNAEAEVVKTKDGYVYKKPKPKKESAIPKELRKLGKVLRDKMLPVVKVYPTLQEIKDDENALNDLLKGELKLTDPQVEAVLATLKSEDKPKIEIIREDLIKYGIEGLEGRILRGLDPAGMLAYSETRAKVEKVAAKLGAEMSKVDELTAELHAGAIWSHANELAKAEDPNILVWLVTAEACDFGKEIESDLEPDDFLKDVDRVNSLLDKAVANPKEFAERARKNAVDSSKEKFELDDGIPVSKFDDAFLAAAINGHKAAIVEDENGLLFVGADKLDYSLLEQLGLTAEQREDRGSEKTFYVDEDGKDIVKVLYQGFCIVLSKDIEVAKTLAKTA